MGNLHGFERGWLCIEAENELVSFMFEGRRQGQSIPVPKIYFPASQKGKTKLGLEVPSALRRKAEMRCRYIADEVLVVYVTGILMMIARD